MMGRSLVLSWSLAWLLWLGGTPGCGEGSSAGAGGSTPPTRFDLPFVVSAGGPVLASPRVQPIYFPGFAFASEVDAFLTSLQLSAYWPAVVADYGVGALTVIPGHTSSVSAPATIVDSDIQGLFAQVMTADVAVLGAPSTDTIYMLFFPAATAITRSGAVLCQAGAPGGFHTEWAVNGVNLAVAVIPSCATFGGPSGLTGVAALTPVIGHELAEAATDPFPVNAPAFSNTDGAHAIWSVAVSGGEVADLCENEAPNLITPADMTLPVPRMWSNAAVLAGTGPCVPVPPGELFFVGVPELPNRITVERAGARFTMPALSVAVGTDATVQVELRAEDGMEAAWTVGALEDHAASGAHPLPAGMSGVRGQTLRLSIIPNEVSAGVFPLVVGSVKGNEHHFWFGAVQRK